MEVMLPQKKSAKKRLRQNEKLNARNRAVRSRMATVDKAVKVGVIKKATADRKKSRLMKAGQQVA
jgi:ribosomal protein S20